MKAIKAILLIGMTLQFYHLQAQEVKSFYIGHSLSDYIPEMVQSLSDHDIEVDFDWRYQSIPGAPLRYQWERQSVSNGYDPTPPYFYGFFHPSEGLPNQSFTSLVLTESVPRQLMHAWGIAETFRFTDSFYVYATQFNPDIRLYLNEPWHCIHSGTPTGCMYDVDSNPWLQRLRDDLPMWEGVLHNLNNKYSPTHPVCLIPSGQALANLSDVIVTGGLPGYSSIFQLFSDDIHLTDIGRYFIACVHYATLLGKSPEGLPHQLQNAWGGNFDAPTPEQASIFQKIAWQTVRDYEHNCLQISSDNLQKSDEKIAIFPNPTGDKLYINSVDKIEIQVYDIYNNLILISDKDAISLGHLPRGLYLVKHQNFVKKIVKL